MVTAPSTSYEAKAKALALKAHQGQVDKAGVPYIKHPETVASLVQTDQEKAVAWLHDVIEDSPISLEDLKALGFPASILQAIDLLTRKKGQSYQDYLRLIKRNELAKKIKIADLTHNSDLSRLPVISPKDLQRQAKYQAAKDYLSRSQDA